MIATPSRPRCGAAWTASRTATPAASAAHAPWSAAEQHSSRKQHIK